MYREYVKGIIEVICGPMFSGKSEELIKRIKILGHTKIKTLVVKPSIDNRWTKDKIISRAGFSIDTIEIQDIDELKKILLEKKYEAIAIDEVQFFENEIVNLLLNYAKKGIRIIVSGLDQDFTGKPFEPVPQLCAIADIVDKQSAVCQKCGKAATMTYRKTKVKNQIKIGNKEYEPRCRICHSIKIF